MNINLDLQRFESQSVFKILASYTTASLDTTDVVNDV